jgi:hypothetical protein
VAIRKETTLSQPESVFEYSKLMDMLRQSNAEAPLRRSVALAGLVVKEQGVIRTIDIAPIELFGDDTLTVNVGDVLYLRMARKKENAYSEPKEREAQVPGPSKDPRQEEFHNEYEVIIRRGRAIEL